MGQNNVGNKNITETKISSAVTPDFSFPNMYYPSLAMLQSRSSLSQNSDWKATPLKNLEQEAVN